jgi:hypothetical protein
LAVRGYVLAKTGWTIEYINKLPELHLLFAYHHCKKAEEDTWDRLGAHLGTLWEREALKILQSKKQGSHLENDTVFVPLSLVINPELPNALLGEPSSSSGAPATSQQTGGDGLLTAMAIPEGEETVNMGDLPREEFIGLITNSGH